jgi:hypothetical protein
LGAMMKYISIALLLSLLTLGGCVWFSAGIG